MKNQKSFAQIRKDYKNHLINPTPEDWYRQYHGLHVLDEVFVETCPWCQERAKKIFMDRIKE